MNNLNRKSFDIFNKNHKIFIEGHRGVNREKPQNTKTSFLKAIEYQLDSIELDIWLSKDKIPVVFHGGNEGELSDFFNSKGSIKNYNIDYLKTLECEGKEKIPLLEEIFQICKNKIFINIEIKDDRIDLLFPILLNLIEKYEMYQQIQISSFIHDYYYKIKDFNEKNKNKKIEFGFLYHPIIERNVYKNEEFNFNFPGFQINIYAFDINEELVNKAKENNMSVMAWFKMLDEENEQIYKKLFDLNVDVICSNEPKKLMIFRENYYKK